MNKVGLALMLFFPFSSAFSQLSPQQVHEAVKSAGGVEKFIKEMASQTSKNLPATINNNLEVYAIASNAKSLMYATRLLSVEKKDVYDLDALKQENINYQGCSTPILGILIKHYGADVTYMVASKNREFLFQYSLNVKTCSR